MMTTQHEAERALQLGRAGVWWRCSDYVIRDGFVRPRKGAAVEPFDPWVREGRDDGGAVLSLAMLVRNLGLERRRGHMLPLALDARQIGLVREWCRRYGLFGLFLHRLEVAYLAPERGHQARIVRSTIDGTPFHSETLGLFGPGQPARVTLRELELPVVRELEFKPTWVRYGLLMKGTPWGVRPQPMSPAFWQTYQEPVEEFLVAAAGFAKVAQELAAGRPPSRDQSGEHRQAVESLRQWIGVVTPTILQDDNGCRRSWMSPSLLGALGVMLSEELTTEQLGSCSKCRRVFERARPQQRFCDAGCRKAAIIAKGRSQVLGTLQLALDGVGGAKHPTVSDRLARAVRRAHRTIGGIKVAMKTQEHEVENLLRRTLMRGQGAVRAEREIDQIVSRTITRLRIVAVTSGTGIRRKH